LLSERNRIMLNISRRSIKFHDVGISVIFFSAQKSLKRISAEEFPYRLRIIAWWLPFLCKSDE
jgi:hypothetical protein